MLLVTSGCPSVCLESVSSMDGTGRPRPLRRRRRGGFSGNVGPRDAGPNGPNDTSGPQSADSEAANVGPTSGGGNQSVTSTNGTGMERKRERKVSVALLVPNVLCFILINSNCAWIILFLPLQTVSGNGGWTIIMLQDAVVFMFSNRLCALMTCLGVLL